MYRIKETLDPCDRRSIQIACAFRTRAWARIGMTALLMLLPVLASAQTVPDAPDIGVAEAGNAVATVEFVPGFDGGSAVTNFTATSTPGGLMGDATQSPIVVSGLTNGVAYTFSVVATNAIGTGSSSSESNQVTPSTIPDAPTIGAAAAGDGAATVQFVPPVDDGGSPILEYVVTSNPGGVMAIGAVSPITVTGLSNGTSYTFAVVASNANGNSEPSSESNSVTPMASTTTSIEGTSVGAAALTGQTFSVDVRVSGESPTGNVQVSARDSGNTIIASCDAALTPDGPGLAIGSCDFPSDTLHASDASTHLSASFAGDADDAASASGDFAFSVNPGEVALSAVISDNDVVVGESTTVTVGLLPVAPAAGMIDGDGTSNDDVTVVADDGTQCSFDLDAAETSCQLVFSMTGPGPTTTEQRRSQSGHAIAAITATRMIGGTYLGGGDFSGSGMTPVPFGTIDVSAADTATSLATGGSGSSANPSAFGETVRLTATVVALAPSMATPTGVVQFTEGATILGTAPLDGSGVAVFDVPAAVAVGPHDYFSFFLSNDDFVGSDDASTHSVATAETATTILSATPASGPDIEALEIVTIQANVTPIAPGNGTPSGTIAITGDDTAGCSISLAAGNSCDLTFSSKGTKQIFAVYSGDSSFSASGKNSDTEQVVVLGIPSTLTVLAAEPEPSYYGDAFVVPYTLTGGNGIFDGDVTVSASAGVTESCVIVDTDGAGSCSIHVPTMPADTYALTGTYAGDSTDLSASFNGPVTHTVLPATTALALSSPVTQPVSVGQSVSVELNLGLTHGAGTPTGVIVVSGPSTSGCSVVLVGTEAMPVQCALSFTAVGDGLNLTATYTPDTTNFSGAVSNNLPFDVDVAETSLSIDAFNPPSGTSPIDDSVGISFTVSGGFGQYDGSIAILVTRPDTTTTACAPISFDSQTGTGACTLDGADIQLAGIHNFAVDYSGDVDDGPSSSNADYTVIRRDTDTQLSILPMGSQQAGQSVDFNVQVDSYSGCRGSALNCRGSGHMGTNISLPTGEAFICDATALRGGSACAMETAICVAVLSGGSGSCSSTFLAAGSYDFVASYQGDDNFNPSNSGSMALDIVAADTSVAITNDLSSATVVGQSLLVAFDVDGGADNPEVVAKSGMPTVRYSGNVTINATLAAPVATASCGPVAVDPQTGTGSCTIDDPNGFLRSGNFALIASYSGDANDMPSSSIAVDHPVVAAATTSALLSGPADPTPFGAPFTLTATVTANAPSTATPVGDVEFFSGAVSLGVRTLDQAGVATFAGLTRPAGTHDFRSVFLANADFSSSVVINEPHVVVPAEVALTLVAAPSSPTNAGDAVVITATVSTLPDGAGMPTGSVSVSASGPTTPSCIADPLNGSGNASTAECTLVFTLPGTYTIAATYDNQDGNFADVTVPSGSIAHEVEAVATTVSIGMIAPASPALVGQIVTVPFSVSGGLNTNDGTVDVRTSPLGPQCDDVVLVASSGTCDLEFATPGTYTISVTYAGDADDAASESSQSGYLVNEVAPTISDIQDQVVLEDGMSAKLPFVIGDDVTVATDLVVTASSADNTLIADGNITISGSDGNRVLQFSPTADQFGGPVTITVTVTDQGGLFVQDTLDVLVAPVNDQPGFTVQGDQIHVSGSSGARTAVGFVQSVDLGANESAQSVQQYVATEISDPDDVVADLAVANNGTLSYTLSGNGGKAQISVVLQDDGGTANGGEDQSVPVEFNVIVGATGDLVVSISNDEAFLVNGRDTAYRIVVENTGPDPVVGVRLINNVPAELANPAWTCVDISEASCPSTSGVGSIDQLLDLPNGGVLQFDLVATVNGTVAAFVTNTASVQLPLTIIDPVGANNSASDTDPIAPDGIFSASFENGPGATQHKSLQAKAAAGQ